MSDSLPPDAVHPLTREAWRAWLGANHTRANGVWLVSFKQHTGQPRVTYDEAVEDALCFGWVDSKPSRLDADRTMLWFAPRKAGSGWSRPNKERIDRATAAGRMQPAGQAKIDAAKRDGSWDRLDAVEDLVIPPDLQAALDAHAGAGTYFAAFPRSAKRGILEWIVNARRAETRASRIEETARLAAENRRANQWTPRTP